MSEPNHAEFILYDWSVDTAHHPAQLLFEQSRERGRHVHVAVDYNHDFPALIEASVSVAAYTDEHGGPVYAIGVGDGRDDQTATYTDEAQAWEAAVELVQALAHDTPWDVAWDASVPARQHQMCAHPLAA